jgi:DnaK suppressor protein
MTKCDTKLFCKILEAEAVGLRRALQNRGGVAFESVSEECEQMTLAGLRELSLVLVDRTSRRLREVEAALRRIEEGDFGTCVDCDEQIPAKRSTAIPWASRCVSCQETADSRTDRKDLFSTPALHNQSFQFTVDAEETMKRAQLAVTALLAASGSLSNRDSTRRCHALKWRRKTDETL